jgi:hypothetical protein
MSDLFLSISPCPRAFPAYATYFRTSDVTPFVENGQIVVYNGEGAQRSWGSPNVKSACVMLTPTCAKVTVTGWHKHSPGPVGGEYYFCLVDGQWVRQLKSSKVVKAAIAEAEAAKAAAAIVGHPFKAQANSNACGVCGYKHE